MIFDTDVLIWALRGNEKAARVIEGDPTRAVSIVTRMELYQGARDKRELAVIRRFLLDFESIPLSENIGHRAAMYMEQLGLSTGLCPMDAFIAATAADRQVRICTANTKHYRRVPDVELTPFNS